MRILLVEDHVELAETVAKVLRREGMAVDVVFDGGAALSHAESNVYDVIVLDRDIPVMDGDEVCRRVVTSGSESRVLMLTAAGTLEDKVEGFGIGADDYLSKPFAFAELLARLRALDRRRGVPVPPILAHGDLRLDSANRIVIRNGQRFFLSPKETAVLEYLLSAGGRIVSAEELLEHIWDENADPFTSTVKVTIRRLRAKLGEPPVIKTISQRGYKIFDPRKDEVG